MSAEDPFWKQKELCWNVVLPDGWNETTPFKEKIHFLRLLECIIHAGSAKVGRVNIANIDYGMVAIYYRDQHHGMTVDCLLYAPFVKEWTVRGDREFVRSWKKERNQFPNHESEENRTKDIIGRIMSKQISLFLAFKKLSCIIAENAGMERRVLQFYPIIKPLPDLLSRGSSGAGLQFIGHVELKEPANLSTLNLGSLNEDFLLLHLIQGGPGDNSTLQRTKTKQHGKLNSQEYKIKAHSRSKVA